MPGGEGPGLLLPACEAVLACGESPGDRLKVLGSESSLLLLSSGPGDCSPAVGNFSPMTISTLMMTAAV